MKPNPPIIYLYWAKLERVSQLLSDTDHGKKYSLYSQIPLYGHALNPLGPKSVQHQFFPNYISRSSRVKVIRITKLITKGIMLWS